MAETQSKTGALKAKAIAGAAPMFVSPATSEEEVGEIFETSSQTRELEPQKKDQVLLLWRDLSMELVKIDVASVKDAMERLS